MIYLISDTHFNQKRIIDYENRPFNSVEEMNRQLINNWNNIVSKEDTIYHLGDFASGNKSEVKNIFDQLNGYKVLIKGNHDRCNSNIWWHDIGFEDVIDGGIILDSFYLLTHEPMYMNINMTPYVNIHGHIHSNKMEGNQYFNVSVEHHNYTPVAFDRIKAMYKSDE